MSETVTAALPIRRAEASAFRGWPALLLTLAVIVAAFYSFSHRPVPPFAPTVVGPETLQVNGLARNGARLVAVGEQGHILVADDAKGPWTEARVEPQRGSTFTQVAFIGNGVALAVGHDSWIVRSEDNGKTWKEVAFNDQDSVPLLGIAGPYDGKLFAFGGFGQYLTSTDNGVSWTKEAPAVLGDRHLNAMTRAADGSLFLVGERGLIVRSTDGGATWTQLPEIYPGSFFGILNTPGRGLLVYGMRGNAFRSSDIGQTWQRVKIPEAVSLFGGATTVRHEIVLVGASNAVFVSRDRGNTFQRVSPGTQKSVATAIPLDNGNLLIAGEAGVMVKDPNDIPPAQPGVTP